MTVLEVKPHKVYIRDLVPYRTAVMFFMAAFLLFYKKQKNPYTLRTIGEVVDIYRG